MTDQPTTRLEALWAGEFGNAYVDRNIAAEQGRRDFWVELLEHIKPANAVEIGCNVGGNLVWIADVLGESNVAGVDVNEAAIEILRERLPGADLHVASGRKLPFDDAQFELAFTIGVLIHQSDAELPDMMSEIVRSSSRYVLCGEYYAAQTTEVPYRGQEGALFKRDFGGIYLERFPDLKLVEQGFLPKGHGSWDDVTWWLLEKPR